MRRGKVEIKEWRVGGPGTGDLVVEEGEEEGG